MLRLVLFSTLLLFTTWAQAQLVINELSNGPSGTKEYVELLVTGQPGCGNCVDLQGWILDDNNGYFALGSGTGIADGHMRFAADPQWACIGVGALIVIYDDGDRNSSIPPDDPTDANGDCVYIIPASSTLFERNPISPVSPGGASYAGPYIAGGDWDTQGMSNNNDSYQTVDPNNTTVAYHGVSYGNNTTNNIIYFAGGGGGRVYAMTNATSNDPFDQNNWVRGNSPADETPGSPNNAANGTWISTLNSNCNPGLSVTIQSDTTICLGDSVDLLAVGPVGTYDWSSGQVGTNTIRVGPASTTTYTVTVDDGTCTGTATATVTVNSPPLLSILGQDTICEGTTTTLIASPLPAVAGNTFSWSTGDMTDLIVTAPTADSIYSVTVTDVNGCTVSADTTVVVRPAPSVQISGLTMLCPDDTTTLTASPAGATYAWSTNETTQSIDVTSAQGTIFWVDVTENGCVGRDSVTINPLPAPTPVITGIDTICLGDSTTLTVSPATFYDWSTGSTADTTREGPTTNTTYTVTVTSLDGCTAEDSIEVIVLNSITAGITGTDTICAGEATVLTATGGSDYLWSDGSTSASIVVSPTSTTTYSVTVNPNGSCSDIADTTVVVNPAPIATIIGPNQACSGDTITLVASGAATGGSTYSWSTGATSNSIDVVTLSDTTFWLAVTNSNGCVDTAFQTVQVDLIPVGLASQDTTICQGATVTLSALGTSHNYLWSTNETTPSIQVTPTATTTYTLTVTSSAGCINIADVTVTVSPNTLAMTDSVVDVSCGGDDDGQIILSTSGGTAPYTYYLSAGGTTIDTVTNGVFTGLQAGTYEVEVIDVAGCNDVITAIEVLGGGLVDANITGTDVSCAGDEDGSITVTATGDGLSYSLNGGAFGPDNEFSPLDAGAYTVVVADTNGCTDTLSYVIDAPTAINAVIDPDSVLITEGNAQILTAVVSGGTGSYTYAWSPAEFLDCTDCQNVTATPSVTTVFALLVADENGCTDSITAIIEVDPEFIIEVPSGFTPNGDGVNDFLRPLSNEAIEFEMSVFNRWGERVYEGEGMPGWNGIFRNEVQPIGTYVYYIRYERVSNGERGELKGASTLVR